MITPLRVLLASLLLLIISSCAQYESAPTRETVHRLTTPVLAAGPPIPENEASTERASESLKIESEEDADSDEEEEEEDELGDDLEAEFEEADKAVGPDPLEGYNRFMTGINDNIYVYVLDPVTAGYVAVVPKGGRRSVGNFFHNLLYPLRLASNLLQAKFEHSGRETLRFVINSTVGILGLFDPARDWFGMERNDEDFGQALGYWGIGAGPHVVLPILGPSNVRDLVGFVPESETDVISRMEPIGTSLSVRAYRLVNDYSLGNLRYTDVKKGNPDLYLFMKNFYEQSRIKKIKE